MITGGMGLTLSSGLVSLFSFAVGGLGLAYLLSDQVGSLLPRPNSCFAAAPYVTSEKSSVCCFAPLDHLESFAPLDHLERSDIFVALQGNCIWRRLTSGVHAGTLLRHASCAD